MKAPTLTIIKPEEALDDGFDGTSSHPEVLAVISALCLHEAALIPSDPRLLQTLWPTVPAPSTDVLAIATTDLVMRGALRKFYVGSEPHLALATETHQQQRIAPPREALAAPQQTSITAQDEAVDLASFQTQVAIDAEREKILLLKVIVALEVLVGLILIRQGLLWYFHL